MDIRPLCTRTTHRVLVHYDMSIQALIERAHFSEVDEFITDERFGSTPRSGKLVREVELVGFGRVMNHYREVRDELAIKGLRPAELREGLALAATFPELQLDRPIIVLGTIGRNLRGEQFCTHLYGAEGERDIGRDHVDLGWHNFVVFAAVRTT